MQYRKRVDGSLKTKSQLIAENPTKSFPAVWTKETAASIGADEVAILPKPPLGKYEKHEELPIAVVAGQWTREWAAVPKYVETREATVAEQIAAAEEAETLDKRNNMIITMRQCRLALLAAGLLDSVDAAIATLPEPDKSAATIAWEYGATVERLSTFVVGMGPLLGLSDLEVDALFEGAKDL